MIYKEGRENYQNMSRSKYNIFLSKVFIAFLHVSSTRVVRLTWVMLTNASKLSRFWVGGLKALCEYMWL